MISSDMITAIGLFVSIVGTIFIAVPVLPRVRRYFTFGKLREAKQSIRFDKLTQRDIGFREVASRHIKNSEYAQDLDVDDIEYISHEPKLSPDFLRTDSDDMPKYTGSSTTDIIFIKYTNKSEGTTHYIHNPTNFYQMFESDMYRGEERVRFFGLFLLAVGFVLQIGGIFI